MNIARGFIARHPILLLDEPTASLDANNRNVVIALIREALAEAAACWIFHDAEVRDAVATRTLALKLASAASLRAGGTGAMMQGTYLTHARGSWKTACWKTAVLIEDGRIAAIEPAGRAARPRDRCAARR